MHVIRHFSDAWLYIGGGEGIPVLWGVISEGVRMEQLQDPTGVYDMRIEEGVTLPPYTLEFTAWIQHCYDLLEAGDESHIMADPFFESGLSDELVDSIVRALDQEFESELGTYPGYHRNRSGANALPEFSRMGSAARRAMVEGCLRIKQKYAIKPVAVPVASPQDQG